MRELFGMPMIGLAVGLPAALALAGLALLLLAWKSPVLVRIGVRNIPRRRTQSVLIVLGLMLSATIITASLGVGDTVNYSIEREVVLALGHTDEVVRSRDIRVFGSDYFPVERYETLKVALAGDPRIDGVTPEVRDVAPVLNEARRRTEPRMAFSGLDPASLAGFGRIVSSDGRKVELAHLGDDEVFVNRAAADELEAEVGDRLVVVTVTGRREVVVAAVVEHGGVAGSQSRVLTTIERAQRMFGHAGEINRINVSNRGDERGGARLSEEVTGELRLAFADPAVADDLLGTLRDPRNVAALRSYAASGLHAGLRDSLQALASEAEGAMASTGAVVAGPEAVAAASDRFRSLLADPDVVAAVALAIERDGRPADAASFARKAATLRLLTVDPIKRNGLDGAQRISDGVTRLFLVFGSFSIIVGMLLIFLIFVLLAAARRTEMGIARAVGAKRRQLVQVFAFEGVLYAVGAALVGTAAGVVASMMLVEFIPQSDQIGFQVARHMEPRSILVAFCLGLVLTVATVAVSAYRVSRLNVVAAIRGVEETGREAVRQAGLRRRAAALVTAALAQGWPAGVAGALLLSRAVSTGSALGVRIGVMLIVGALGLVLYRVLRLASVSPSARLRIAVTVTGLASLAFWSLPFQVLFEVFGQLEGGTELFVLAGVTMVTSAVVVVMFNAQAFVWAAGRTIGRIGRLAPVLRIAIAYPMAARFRTGLTLAMFALIIFTLMVIAILTNTSQLALDHIERVTGGYEVSASVPVDRPIADIDAALAGVPGVNARDITAVASSINVPAQARQPGASNVAWRPVSVRAVDRRFLETNLFEIAHYDPAYGTAAREIWDALAADPTLAVVNSAALTARFQQGLDVRGERFTVEGLFQEDPATIAAFTVELTDPSGSRSPAVRTVIGVTDQLADLLGDFPQVTSRADVLDEISARPVPLVRYHLRLAAGVDARDIADLLETGLIDRGFQASVAEREVRELLSVNSALNQLFQSFMGLGLVVGVAALGVISFRAVVERRQAIGMLKAIGFKSRMIWLGFLLESSVVALLGILLGLGLGSLISWNIVNELKDQVEGLQFQVPWANVAVIVSIAWGFSILSTLWPARQASKIYAAEALRYE
jgi:putative ABC transport system permease protein